ncbi:MAG: hypothetical protein MK180_16150 [Rhodobacteraceae bacterium]|nr:hypothetical protein [Paracoccaceae bacterium]
MRVLLLLLLLPASVHAGAWARGEGETFASLGLEGKSSGATLTFYGEYGYSDRITLGVDGFLSEDNTTLSAVAFARYTFPSAGANVWAVSGGLGGEYRIDEREQQLVADGPITVVDQPRMGAFLRIGGHYGRGLENGWLAADFSYDIGKLLSLDNPPRPDEDIQRVKLDLTYGRRVSDKLSVIGQVFLQDYDGTASQSVQVGSAYSLGETTLEGGVRQGFGPSSETTLKLGLWQRF